MKIDQKQLVTIGYIAKKFKMSIPLIRYYLLKKDAPVPIMKGRVWVWDKESLDGWKPLKKQNGRPRKQ